MTNNKAYPIKAGGKFQLIPDSYLLAMIAIFDQSDVKHLKATTNPDLLKGAIDIAFEKQSAQIESRLNASLKSAWCRGTEIDFADHVLFHIYHTMCLSYQHEWVYEAMQDYLPSTSPKPGFQVQIEFRPTFVIHDGKSYPVPRGRHSMYLPLRSNENLIVEELSELPSTTIVEYRLKIYQSFHTIPSFDSDLQPIVDAIEHLVNSGACQEIVS